MMRQLVGAVVQLRVRQLLCTKRHSERVGRSPDASLEQPVDARLAGIVGCGLVPLDQRAMPFLACEKGKLGQPLVRVGLDRVSSTRKCSVIRAMVPASKSSVL